MRQAPATLKNYSSTVRRRLGLVERLLVTQLPEAQGAVLMSCYKAIVVMPFGCRAYCDRSNCNAAEHVQQGMPVDGSDKQALASYNPQHPHGRPDIKSSD